ncbi:MAG: hypothetical protein QOJ04_863 [Caballeronia sp.]|nr:hypothetical protein [Caballeronia sp.]
MRNPWLLRHLNGLIARLLENSRRFKFLNVLEAIELTFAGCIDIAIVSDIGLNNDATAHAPSAVLRRMDDLNVTYRSQCHQGMCPGATSLTMICGSILPNLSSMRLRKGTEYADSHDDCLRASSSCVSAETVSVLTVPPPYRKI